MWYDNDMWNWDYQLPNDWKPTTDAQWEWFLVRKLNYGDVAGLQREVIQRHFPNIKERLDPGVRAMFEYYLTT